ncbi:MAG: SIS domain-containing protein [Magnetococcales bacterium]|nr:SIS domain-containing protein [Magnetococcales bacterium]MBF0322746.1 SIS domain-containing protein [Magnetococcales bacterium]
MTTCPTHRHDKVDTYFQEYVQALLHGLHLLDQATLSRVCDTLVGLYRRGGKLFVCGNGGSAAISNHLLCDHLKGVRTDTGLLPKVISLSTNLEIITAIANDISYADVFVYQLASLAAPQDVLLTISASGDSENIVRAVQWAREHAVTTMALTGFAGGRSAQLADFNLHIPVANYGIVEDAHQAIMHILAQFIRQWHMNPETVAKRKF